MGGLVRRAGVALDAADVVQRLVERAGQALVDQRRVIAFDEMRFVAVAVQQLEQLGASDARQQRRVGDLVAVEVQDRQHGTVVRRIQELVRLPARRERAGLGLAIADDAGDDQVRVVERRPVGVRQRVAQLAAFVDRAGRFRRDVARDAARPRELAEQPAQPAAVALDRGVVLGVRAFKVGARHDARPAVPGADDEHQVQVVVGDEPVQVHVEQVQPRRRAPVAEQPRLDMCQHERHVEQRVLLQVDLADRQVVGGPPGGVHPAQQVRRQGLGHPDIRGQGGLHGVPNFCLAVSVHSARGSPTSGSHFRIAAS